MNLNLSASTNAEGNIVIENEALLKQLQKRKEKGKEEGQISSETTIDVIDNPELSDTLQNVSPVVLQLSSSARGDAIILLRADKQGVVVYPAKDQMDSSITEIEKSEPQHLLESIAKPKGTITPEVCLDHCKTIQRRYPTILRESFDRLFAELHSIDPENVLDDGKSPEEEMLQKARLRLMNLTLELEKLILKEENDSNIEESRNAKADTMYKKIRQESIEDTYEIVRESTFANAKNHADRIKANERLCRSICAYAMVAVPTLEKLVEKRGAKQAPNAEPQVLVPEDTLPTEDEIANLLQEGMEPDFEPMDDLPMPGDEEKE